MLALDRLTSKEAARGRSSTGLAPGLTGFGRTRAAAPGFSRARGSTHQRQNPA
jgi:hypothetical protein